MKIAFVDLVGIDYNPLTPDSLPLGGMQSGVSYLSRELAQCGHDVHLFNMSPHEGRFGGVQVHNFKKRSGLLGSDGFSGIISISCDGQLLRTVAGQTPLVLYTGHNDEEHSVQKLSDAQELASWDRIVLKSVWQLQAFQKKLGIPADKLCIIHNAASPAFHALPLREDYFFTSRRPPVLYYSSTPFRGLDVLAAAFPRIRQGIPGVTAKVFSSMAVYQQFGSNDPHAQLYRSCKAAGMEYCGSISQPKLAQAVRAADILAFPSTYPETACITAMEAMLNGAMILGRSLGALPETTASFGHFMPERAWQDVPAMARDYAEHVIRVVQQYRAQPSRGIAHLAAQQAYARQNFGWPERATAFVRLLEDLADKARGNAALVDQPPVPRTYVKSWSGEHIYFDIDDARGQRLLLAGGNFNPEALQLWKVALASAAWTHVCDVGANYGEMLCNGGLPEGSQVWAFEPNTNLLPYLRQTLAGKANTRIFDCALGEQDEQLPFLVDKDWSGRSKLLPAGAAGPSVAVRPLADVLHKEADVTPEAVSLAVKVDVEGKEWQVLAGLLPVLPRLHRFCGMVEVSHMPKPDADLLFAHFDVFAMNPLTQGLTQISALESLAKPGNRLWNQDVIIRRKGEGSPAPAI